MLSQMKKMWGHTHTMEYYSAIKKNEITPFAATWMDLEIYILSEVTVIPSQFLGRPIPQLGPGLPLQHLCMKPTSTPTSGSRWCKRTISLSGRSTGADLATFPSLVRWSDTQVVSGGKLPWLCPRAVRFLLSLKEWLEPRVTCPSQPTPCRGKCEGTPSKAQSKKRPKLRAAPGKGVALWWGAQDGQTCRGWDGSDASDVDRGGGGEAPCGSGFCPHVTGEESEGGREEPSFSWLGWILGAVLSLQADAVLWEAAGLGFKATPDHTSHHTAHRIESPKHMPSLHTASARPAPHLHRHRWPCHQLRDRVRARRVGTCLWFPRHQGTFLTQGAPGCAQYLQDRRGLLRKHRELPLAQAPIREGTLLLAGTLENGVGSEGQGGRREAPAPAQGEGQQDAQLPGTPPPQGTWLITWMELLLPRGAAEKASVLDFRPEGRRQEYRGQGGDPLLLRSGRATRHCNPAPSHWPLSRSSSHWQKPDVLKHGLWDQAKTDSNARWAASHDLEQVRLGELMYLSDSLLGKAVSSLIPPLPCTWALCTDPIGLGGWGGVMLLPLAEPWVVKPFVSDPGTRGKRSVTAGTLTVRQEIKPSSTPQALTFCSCSFPGSVKRLLSGRQGSKVNKQ
ncbi:LINE-1 retrotransposable element ORF2 protein [Camelus dromedarius]|uniref:LINE-1 retrotransposable element ORF2 protein n=1 Tax=Camelus dromedarius TaxID=9838 RepID=A0A5N4E5E0_CAMDR|nr:LINE-1 retrotransposable element ORF2 protein [Camelus dromedarius]